jgi:hypothetical protein
MLGSKPELLSARAFCAAKAGAILTRSEDGCRCFRVDRATNHYCPSGTLLLPQMKQPNSRLTVVLAATLLASCGYPGPPKPPSLNLPRPVKDLQATRKGNYVYLTWTAPTESTDSLMIRQLGSTRICRSSQPVMTDCASVAGEVAAPALPAPSKTAPAPRLQQNFIGPLPPELLGDNPSAQIQYAVSVLNVRGRSAGISNVAGVPAIIAPLPPSDFRGEATAAGVVLSWSPIAPPAEGPDIRHFYRIYRREVNNTADTIVGEAPLASSQLTDQSFDWEKTYFYRATVVTAIGPAEKPESQFESEDTPAVKVFAHDVFPPAVPTGLQAGFSGVGQQLFIDLIWAPDTEADLTGYNVYRHEEGGEARKINTAPVKMPSFRDTNIASGHTYIYSVAAIDVRGNESARSSETSETVP